MFFQVLRVLFSDSGGRSCSKKEAPGISVRRGLQHPHAVLVSPKRPQGAISSVNQARSRLGLSEASNVSQDVSHRVSELGLAMLKVPDQSVQAREGWTVNADDITLEVIPSSGRRVSTFFHDSYPFTIEDPSSEKLDARSGLVKVLEIGTEGSFLDSVWSDSK